jgi:type VI secretion system secreted protein Hcp
MASDYLLELDGIKGESKDKLRPGTIEVSSFSWGVTNPGSAIGGSGGGAVKPVFQDLSFVKNEDSTSPLLFLRAATGEHIKKAVLFVRKSGRDQEEYMKIELSDILVTSFQQSSGEDVPVDSVSLNFSKIQFTHTPQSADGRAGTPVVATYDLKTNTKG